MPTHSYHNQFPGYEILGEIGRGNARVLKARNQLTGEIVAIKHFPANTDEETIRRFRRESEIMTSINHPNIVKIKEVNLQGAIPFIVMELIEDGDLRSLLEKRGSLDIPTVISLGLQMADAFEAIHEMGIIHRDIKPENIMCRQRAGEEVNFLLTDFGTAKLREQSNTLTGTSMMTYEYASPEQFENPKSVTAATDYYSMGVILYECLAGCVPFMLADALAPFIQKVLSSSPPVLKLPAGGFLPTELNSLIVGLLAKNYQVRIKEPATVHAMLQQAEVGGPVENEENTAASFIKEEETGKIQNGQSKRSIYYPAMNRLAVLLGIAPLVTLLLVLFAVAIREPPKYNESISGNSPYLESASAPPVGATEALLKLDSSKLNVDTIKKSIQPLPHFDRVKYDNGKYVGQFHEIQENGKYQWKNGGKYVKDWPNVFVNGKGINFNENGNIYKGKWMSGRGWSTVFVNGKPNN
jgi:serine/threonine protein kinase